MAIKKRPEVVLSDEVRVPVTNLSIEERDQLSRGPIDYGIEEGFSVHASESLRDDNEIAISILTGEPHDQITAAMETPEGSRLVNDKVLNDYNTNSEGESSVYSEEDPDVYANSLVERQAKLEEIFGPGSGYALLDNVSAADAEEIDAITSRVNTNRAILSSVLEKRFADTNEQGWFPTVLDFIDRYMIRYIGVGQLEDLTGRSSREGYDIMANLIQNSSPEEMAKWAEEYADKLADEGFFTSENWFALQEGLTAADHLGVDPDDMQKRVLAGIDVGLTTVPLVGGIGKGISKIAAVRGVSAANKMVKNVVKSGLTANASVADDLLPSSHRLGAPGSPSAGTGNVIIEFIKAQREAKRIERVGTEAELTELSKEIGEKVGSDTNLSLLDYAPEDYTGLGNDRVRINLGRPDGGTFKTKKGAQGLVEEVMEKGYVAEVVKIGEKKWAVQVTEDISTTNIPGAANLEDIADGIFSYIFSSSYTDSVGTISAQVGEGAFLSIKDFVDPILADINKLGSKSRATMDKVFRNLNHGPDAARREWYSAAEFRAEWRKLNNGIDPTDAEMKAYENLVTISDAHWELSATKILKKYTDQGTKMVQYGGTYIPATPAKSIPEKAIVKDLTNPGVTYNTRKALDDVDVWKLDKPLSDGTEYVARPVDVRLMELNDAMPFNAGGRRIYDDTNYFVVSGDRAIMTTFSNKQAAKAVEGMNAIVRELKALGITKLDNLNGVPRSVLDDLIGRHGKFAGAENLDDFKAFVTEHNIDITKEAFQKGAGAPIDGVASSMWDGTTVADYFKHVQARADKPLPQFGNVPSKIVSPVEAIVGQLNSAATEYAYRAATHNAKVGFIKRANSVDKIPAGANINKLFDDAFAKHATGTDKRARQLRALGNQIRRRENAKGDVAQAMDSFGQQLREFVFDKTGMKIGPKDPVGALLHLGFQSAFGFLNMSQFFLQASHALTIVAVSPLRGMEAVGMVIPMRMIMNITDDATKALAIKRLAKVSGYTEKNIQELVEHMSRSGRYFVGDEALQAGMGPSFGVSMWDSQSRLGSKSRAALLAANKGLKRAGSVGTFAFREGERLSRHTATMTAALEYMAQNPGKSIRSTEAVRAITARDHALSLNMTTASRGAWEQGLMKVPTQWLSYSMRYMEALVVGRGFTKKERVKLGLMMAVTGGSAGFGMGQVADELSEKFGFDYGDKRFTTLKYGVVDGILSWALEGVTGEEVRTAFGTRMAPMTAFFDIWQKATEGSLVEAFGGPSGSIIVHPTKALINATAALYNGNFEIAEDDFWKFIRTPSGIDNVVKAAKMWNKGVYQSKTGSKMEIPFSKVEAYLQALGVTNFKVAEYYDIKGQRYKSAKEIAAIKKRYVPLAKKAIEMFSDGDVEGGNKLLREIEVEIQLNVEHFKDQMAIRRALFSDVEPFLWGHILHSFQNGDQFEIDKATTLLGKR